MSIRIFPYPSMSDADAKRGGGGGGDSRRKKARYMARRTRLASLAARLTRGDRAALAAVRLCRTARRVCWFPRTRAKTA